MGRIRFDNEGKLIMKTLRYLLTASLVCLTSTFALAQLQVVATTEDMAALAREVGGHQINATAIAKGYQDPHFVDAKPSYLLRLRSADVLIVVGLELEVGWLPPLLTNARNSRIIPGYAGYIDASRGCDILQKPTGGVDRSLGAFTPSATLITGRIRKTAG
jgi:zinc/manganese transport system substrate-binding protein